MKWQLPDNVSFILATLVGAGYEAYAVGGCVRDMLMDIEPKDYDVTTNAIPSVIIEIFEKLELRVVYENNFGTVAIVFEDEADDSNVRIIEITPFRTEGDYSDKRRPDDVTFAQTLDEDLQRRDFTVNAMALGYKGQIKDSDLVLYDPYGGQNDIKTTSIRAVGNPTERFQEDALRLMRAVRFAAQKGFTIEEKTAQALRETAPNIQHVSWERIRDEFTKIIMSNELRHGVDMLREFGLIEHISPELVEGIGVQQNRSHIYGVWEHNLRAGDNAAKQNWPLHIRLSALFHDVGKPRTKRYDKQKKVTTFYGHEVVGARMVKKFLERMRYPKKLSEIVIKLVRYHMFFSDPDKISLSAIRRMIRNVGAEHIWDLMNVRRSDRIGMGRPKAAPYRLRMYESMIEEALRDPVDVSMLAMNGDIMIGEMGMKPGREIGWILHALLEEVLDNPKLNTRGQLEERVRDLLELDAKDLEKLGQRGKVRQEEADAELIASLRKKHGVR